MISTINAVSLWKSIQAICHKIERYKKIKARVIKGVGGEFVVMANDVCQNVYARKKLKTDKVYVGDFVEVDAAQNVIEKVYDRKNKLVRPPVANVEQVLLLLAPVPKPDFLLVDKLLIKYLSLGIEPIIVVNKMDMDNADEWYREIVSQYQKFTVLGVSAKTDADFTKLLDLLAQKFTLLTGQSAVGKTSLLNKLLKTEMLEVGELSKKTARGKNTTRHSQIFVLHNGGLIADSPGFSAFELDNFTPEDIVDYTLEFEGISQQCKYNDCNHIGEDESICAVKRILKEGKINKERYSRYCELFGIAKEKEDKKYE